MLNRRSYPFFFLFLLIALVACRDEVLRDSEYSSLTKIPFGFPDIEYPEGNEFTPERWELGKKLFYDPILSIDNNISCGSCHQQSLAFADDKPFSLGVNNIEGRRNAPSLANVAYHPYFTREGGISTLEMQILIPIQEHDELNHNIVAIAELLAEDENYVRMSQEAYNRQPDPYVITRAISNFQRTLISGNSAYDRYRQYGYDLSFSDKEKQGMELFFSDRLACAKCHGGFNFTDYSFENNGLYEDYPDEGRFRLTSEFEDLARFKTPSLRNIALTAPYMHDGSIADLNGVVEHYMTGGSSHPNKNSLVNGFELNDEEKENLILFLESLSDLNFIHQPMFKK